MFAIQFYIWPDARIPRAADASPARNALDAWREIMGIFNVIMCFGTHLMLIPH
jgi:hypothetical protein